MLCKTIKIDKKKLLDSGLLIEAYFLLECISKSDREYLEMYVDKCGKVSRLAVEQLLSKGYIDSIPENITFSAIRLTEKSVKFLGNNALDHDRFFKELRDSYLKKTPDGRPLQTNIESCKKKYRDIVKSEETHTTILKCIKLHFEYLRVNNKLEFAQALPAFLNQKNYESYWEDALKLDSNVSEEEGYDAV